MFRYPVITIVALALFAGGLSASGIVHAAAAAAPPGHVTIHRFANQGTRLIASPSQDSCVDVHTGAVVSPGALLSSPNPGVSCVPSGSFGGNTACYEVDAGGYHAAAGGGILSVTSACGPLQATQAMSLPFSNPGASSQQTGAGVTPWTCTTDETLLVGGASADFWVFCDVNVTPPPPSPPHYVAKGVSQNGFGLPGPCDSSNPNYQPQQTTHVFIHGSTGSIVDGVPVGTFQAYSFDTSGCAAGDGDHETGVGGAQFPETSQGACDPPAPWNGHHNGGPGAKATVQSNTANLPVDYFFGTDGQDPAAWQAGQACTSNNAITDSYDSDPFDCGQGVTGHFPSPSIPAMLAPNPNPHSGVGLDIDPWATTFGAVPWGALRTDPNGVECFGVHDGSAWAFLVAGPSIVGGQTVGTSTPIQGLITAP